MDVQSSGVDGATVSVDACRVDIDDGAITVLNTLLNDAESLSVVGVSDVASS